MEARKTYSVEILIGNTVKSYAANVDKSEVDEAIAKNIAGEVATLRLGEGTSYLEGNEYADNAVLTILPSAKIGLVVAHELTEKKAVNLKTKE